MGAHWRVPKRASAFDFLTEPCGPLRRDAQIADFVLDLDTAAPAPPAAPTPGPAARWPTERLKRYIAWARATFQPQVSAAAQEVLLAYFRKQRGMAALVYAPTERLSVRFLESLVRLSQAHARLMARHTVEVADAAAALLPVDTCAHVTSTLNMRFAAPPHRICELSDGAHAAAAAELLRSLGLTGTPVLPPPPPPAGALEAAGTDHAEAPAVTDSAARPVLCAVQMEAAKSMSAGPRGCSGTHGPAVGSAARAGRGGATATYKRAASSHAALCVPTQQAKRACSTELPAPVPSQCARRAHTVGHIASLPPAVPMDDEDVDLSELDNG